jgi:hypothetical protein
MPSRVAGTTRKRGVKGRKFDNEKHLRLLSWRLRCSLRLKALLQNWHLYFFSGANDDFRMLDDDAVGGRTDMLPGILTVGIDDCPSHRSIVEIVWLASVGVRFKACLD